MPSLKVLEVSVMKSILTVPKRKEFLNLNLSFAYIEGESLMMGIKNLAVYQGQHVPASLNLHMF